MPQYPITVIPELSTKCISGDTFAVESDVEEAAVEEIETVVAVHGAGTVERLLGEGVAVVVNNVQLLEVVNNRRLLQVSHRALHAAWVSHWLGGAHQN